MLDHHIQRSIIYKLALAKDMRFSELKPAELDNKLFTYHLKKVVLAGLVKKNDSGVYELTAEGRILGIRAINNYSKLAESAESVMFIVLRRKSDNAWLLYKRNIHPLQNKIGFMHAIPSPDEELSATAKKLIYDKLNLNGEFKTLGGGLFRVYQADTLESFTNFSLLYCDDISGEVNSSDEYAEYEWVIDPDFSSPDMLPNMSILAELYSKKQVFFIEEKLTV